MSKCEIEFHSDGSTEDFNVRTACRGGGREKGANKMEATKDHYGSMENLLLLGLKGQKEKIMH